MSSYSRDVRALILDLLWSQWAELGVSGWERHHGDSSIDVESLVLATARLVHLDARLRDEALDWCVAHGRLLSAVRLKRLLALWDDETRARFAAFAATVNAHSTLRWPDGGERLTWSPTGRSAPPDLARPALLQLRLRALWGVTARAEVLRVMLAAGDRFMGIREVAIAAAYGKDAVADALDNLHRGGLLDVTTATTAGNQLLYRPTRIDALLNIAGPLPRIENWMLVWPVIAGMLELAETPETTPMARAADIQRHLRAWQPSLTRLGVVAVPPATGTDLPRTYERWSLNALRTWARTPKAAAAR